MMNNLFADTFGWASLCVKREPHHPQARQIFTQETPRFHLNSLQSSPPNLQVEILRYAEYLATKSPPAANPQAHLNNIPKQAASKKKLP